MSELVSLSAWEQRRLIRTGELAPSELVAACLEQVERWNGEVNALCTLNPRALDEARALDERATAEPEAVGGTLYGLPVGIKDTTRVRGLRTTFGSPLYADHVPKRDDGVVRRIREAGAVVLAKTNVPEFAAGGHTVNELFGPTHNPWNLKLSAGGSTGGGAAALASGMVSLAQGSDLGGSLRMPASFCGVVGLRPSPGLVPSEPAAFLFDTLSVNGPMGRTVEDVALLLDAMAVEDPRAPIYQRGGAGGFEAAARRPPGRLRLAYCRDVSGIGIDHDVEAVCRRAAFELSQGGHAVEEVELDLSAGRRAFSTLRGLWMVTEHRERLHRRAELGENLRGNLESGLAVTSEELAEAEGLRVRIATELLGLLERFDHLLTPTMAVPPFEVTASYPRTVGGQEMPSYIDWFAPTFVLSLTALPVLSVPCGLDPRGLPVGVQIVGRPRGEGGALALGAVLQEARPVCLPRRIFDV